MGFLNRISKSQSVSMSCDMKSMQCDMEKHLNFETLF